MLRKAIVVANANVANVLYRGYYLLLNSFSVHEKSTVD